MHVLPGHDLMYAAYGASPYNIVRCSFPNFNVDGCDIVELNIHCLNTHKGVYRLLFAGEVDMVVAEQYLQVVRAIIVG